MSNPSSTVVSLMSNVINATNTTTATPASSDYNTDFLLIGAAALLLIVTGIVACLCRDVCEKKKSGNASIQFIGDRHAITITSSENKLSLNYHTV